MALFMFLFGVVVLRSTTITAQFPPEQIHIMFGPTPDVMTFNWLTFDYPISTRSIIRAGLSEQPNTMNIINEGTTTLFTDNGSLRTNRTIHVVNITDLLPATRYFYQVGDPVAGWSTTYSFTTQHSPASPYKFIAFGDLGIYNSLCLNAMIEECLDGEVDAVLYFGDMAYDMYNNNGLYGDQFMNMLEPLGSRCAIMAGPGNHEKAYNFSHFTERWRGMPNPGNTNYPFPGSKQVRSYNGYAPNNWYFSYNIGEIHIVSISTEIYLGEQKFLINAQNEWLQKDLEEANKNRSSAPWIIVHGHRNMYCSSQCGGFCTSDAQELRGYLEAMFFEYGVDIYLSGHSHNFERMYDIFGSYSNKLTVNMTATTYIVTGAAGTCEYNTVCCPFYDVQPEWSAVRSLDYSYSRLHVYNATHIRLQQVLYDGKTVIDDVWFEQYQHGPFNQSMYTNNKNTVSFSDKNNVDDSVLYKYESGEICKNFIKNITG